MQCSLRWGRRTYLLDSSDVARDVFHCDRVFHSETMALAFYPCLVNQDATVGSQACILSVKFVSSGGFHAHQQKQGKRGHPASQPCERYGDLAIEEQISSPRPVLQRPCRGHRPTKPISEVEIEASGRHVPRMSLFVLLLVHIRPGRGGSSKVRCGPHITVYLVGCAPGTSAHPERIQ